MSHHFVQQLIHVIWSTKNQSFKMPLPVRNELYAYLSTVIKSNGGKLYLAGGYHDHVHCLLSLPPVISIATMMKFIKISSSKWIKYQPSIDPQFSWEDGYTSISVQDDRIDSVCSYIKGDEKRHVTMDYGDELLKILELQNIPYEEKYFLRNSHSKILLHVIWSTKNRIPSLDKSIRPILYEVMSDVVGKAKGVVYAIGGIEDHVHLLIENSRAAALSDLVNEVKGAASRFLFTQGNVFHDFEWQTGYGAFSISVSTLDVVKRYVMQQEEHHSKATSFDEWEKFILNKGLI